MNRKTQLTIPTSTKDIKALVASEMRYRRLFETACDGILILNAETGNIDEVNPYLIKMLNYSHEELLGKKLWDIGLFKDVVRAKELFKETQKHGYVRYDDLPLKSRTGETVDVEFVSNLYDDAGVKVIQCNIRDIGERKAAEAQIVRYQEKLETALMGAIKLVTMVSEAHDPYTAAHGRRVGEIASAIGAEMGIDEQVQAGLLICGYLHDIGKSSIPTEILSKPGKISNIEFELIKGHAQAGYDILGAMEWPWPVAEVALQHHERIDGTGYPNGRTGEAIILEARIIAVADIVEAMSSHRPYRAALGIDSALNEIESGCGTKYDVDVANACLRLFKKNAFQLPQ